MIKLVYCVRRRADISEAEFFRYWKEEHGPLVKSVARDLRARRYLQSHTTAAVNHLRRIAEMFHAPVLQM